MNLLDAIVVKILSQPFCQYDRWWIKVEYDCWGKKGQTNLMFSDIETAKNISTGYKFMI